MNQLKWGLVDLDGNTVLPFQYDFVDDVSENGIVSVCRDGVERYIHLDGTSAVPGDFERAFPFRAGLALVQKGGVYGMINEDGEQIIECQYDTCLNFSSDLAAARLNGKYGYINRKGDVMVPLVYEDAQIPSEGCGWLMDSNEMWGCVDTEGKLRIPFKYQEAERFGESLAFVIGNDHKGFINLSDELVIEPDGWSRSSGGFSDNVACVTGVPRRGRSWGYSYIDHTGRFAMKRAFNEAYSFAFDRACIRLKKRWGFIDKLGDLIIPAIYEEIVGLGFERGMAAVQYNGKYGCIDLNGDVIVPFQYDLVAITNRGLLRVAFES